MKRNGFTLIELLVVIAILSILVTLGSKGLRSARISAKKAKAMVEMQAIETSEIKIVRPRDSSLLRIQTSSVTATGNASTSDPITISETSRPSSFCLSIGHASRLAVG